MKDFKCYSDKHTDRLGIEAKGKFQFVGTAHRLNSCWTTVKNNERLGRQGPGPRTTKAKPRAGLSARWAQSCSSCRNIPLTSTPSSRSLPNSNTCSESPRRERSRRFASHSARSFRPSHQRNALTTLQTQGIDEPKSHHALDRDDLRGSRSSSARRI